VTATPPRLSFARLAALLPLVLLLLGGTVAAAVHHHDGAADACAICVHAHAPAAAVTALASGFRPAAVADPLTILAARTPVLRALRSTASRGPPTA